MLFIFICALCGFTIGVVGLYFANTRDTPLQTLLEQIKESPGYFRITTFQDDAIYPQYKEKVAALLEAGVIYQDDAGRLFPAFDD